MPEGQIRVEVPVRVSEEMLTLAKELVSTKFQSKPASLNRRAGLGVELADLLLNAVHRANEKEVV